MTSDCSMSFFLFSTPELLNKKHLNFDQGLEFLKFGQGNRGLNQQNRRKSKETIRNNKVKRWKIDKKIRDRDPYFLPNHFLFAIFSVGAPTNTHTQTILGIATRPLVMVSYWPGSLYRTLAPCSITEQKTNIHMHDKHSLTGRRLRTFVSSGLSGLII